MGGSDPGPPDAWEAGRACRQVSLAASASGGVPWEEEAARGRRPRVRSHRPGAAPTRVRSHRHVWGLTAALPGRQCAGGSGTT